MDENELAAWQKSLYAQINKMEGAFDRLKGLLWEQLDQEQLVVILPYRGFGNPHRAFLKGRILKKKGIEPGHGEMDFWSNLLNMYNRFESDEISNARLAISFGGNRFEVTCDEEGYFETYLEPLTPIQSDDLWAAADLELLDPLPDILTPCTAQGKILIPPASSEYGVISDVDDTIVQTDSANVIRLLRTMLFEDAGTRQPIPGFSTFYRSLHRGISGTSRNPIFYVSSSPWNLYDLLFDFIQLHEIPLDAVLLLRDYGISKEEILPTRHHSHKLKYIQIILDMYPDLPFILIGDNGQDDPEIYAQVGQQNPGRILAIYIRAVDKSPERSGALQSLLGRLPDTQVKTIIVEDSLQMASHAREMGWIGGNPIEDAA